jgi:hypothetical protein
MPIKRGLAKGACPLNGLCAKGDAVFWAVLGVSMPPTRDSVSSDLR